MTEMDLNSAAYIIVCLTLHEGNYCLVLMFRCKVTMRPWLTVGSVMLLHESSLIVVRVKQHTISTFIFLHRRSLVARW